MIGIAGAGLALVGGAQLFDVLVRGPDYLLKDLQLGPNDTKCKQISRIAANALRLIGLFSLGIGMIAMGSTLYSTSLTALSATAVLLPSVEKAVIAALPYFIGALVTLTANLIVRHVAR